MSGWSSQYYAREVSQQGRLAYLGREALYKDGHQQVEKHIVSKGHECYKVEGGPMAGLLHTIEEYNIPVLLGEYLWQEGWQRGGEYFLSVVIMGEKMQTNLTAVW